MSGQELFSDFSLRLLARRTSTYLSDPKSHEPEFGYSDLSHSKIEKGNAQFPVHLGNSPDEDSIRRVELYQKVLTKKQRSVHVTSHSSRPWTRIQTRSTRRTIT